MVCGFYYRFHDQNGVVFTGYVQCTYAVKYVNFESTGAMVCGF